MTHPTDLLVRRQVESRQRRSKVVDAAIRKASRRIQLAESRARAAAVKRALAAIDRANEARAKSGRTLSQARKAQIAAANARAVERAKKTAAAAARAKVVASIAGSATDGSDGGHGDIGYFRFRTTSSTRSSCDRWRSGTRSCRMFAFVSTRSLARPAVRDYLAYAISSQEQARISEQRLVPLDPTTQNEQYRLITGRSLPGVTATSSTGAAADSEDGGQDAGAGTPPPTQTAPTLPAVPSRGISGVDASPPSSSGSGG